MRFLENKVNELKKEKAALEKKIVILENPEAFIEDSDESNADDSGSMSLQNAEEVAKQALKTIEVLEARNALLMQENETLRSQKDCEQPAQLQNSASILGMVCTKIKQ